MRISAQINTNQLSLRIAGGQALEFIWIKPGQFLMGAPDSDKLAEPDEKPQRLVHIEHGFYLGRTTVTVGQFKQFVNETGYKTDAETDQRPHYQGGHGYNATRHRFEGYFPQYTWRNPGWSMTDTFPVGDVSWNDAMAFCKWLGTKTTMKVHLPSEAEWEYACRAGTTNRFFTGNDPASLKGYANVPDQSSHRGEPPDASWFPFDDGYVFTAPVGSFKPNPWGLYDMIGNVFQWCSDEVLGPPPGSTVSPEATRILRGGCYDEDLALCRCSARGHGAPWSRYAYTGFRVLMLP
jgi:formylglycine-generating enzyme required for sulfatase activity